MFICKYGYITLKYTKGRETKRYNIILNRYLLLTKALTQLCSQIFNSLLLYKCIFFTVMFLYNNRKNDI